MASGVIDVVLSRRHLLFVLSGPLASRLNELRRRWDPVMAARIPPHVTLVYPEEYSDDEMLRRRIESAVADTGPFDLVVGPLNANLASGGVWLSVSDPARGWWALRQAVLSPPFRPIRVEPHVTVVNPRTSDLGAGAIQEMGEAPVVGTVEANEVIFADTAPPGLQIVDRFPLEEPGSEQF